MAALDEVTPASGAPATGVPPELLVEPARRVFGDRLDIATTYARLLVSEGVLRGLIGPHEAVRVWDRHLLNCAVVGELVPAGATVTDVGSGAGLPGIPLAIARPDLTVVLLEPLARRTAFLVKILVTLGLGGAVTVVRARAEETTALSLPLAAVVTARALAPLDRLAAYCLPLAAVGGRVLAIKGDTGPAEANEHAGAIARLGGSAPRVVLCGSGAVPAPTRVVEFDRERVVTDRRRRRR